MKKEDMKRFVFVFLLSGLLFSCGLSEIGGIDETSGGNDIWGGPVEDVDVPDALNYVCYMTALEYPKGYDWHSDQGVGQVRCSLVVYMDGKPIMKVPVGEEYEVSSDPDMHRVLNGHLYTDYSSATETVIKKDGRDLYRFEGRERICGIEVYGEDVYILGEDRDGQGFTYRKNGEILMERENGSIVGELRCEDGSVSFAFVESIKISDGFEERYYVVRDGVVSQTAVREDVKKVWDILPLGEDVAYIASLTSILYPVLIRGEDLRGLLIPGGADIVSFRLLSSQGNICVDGIFKLKDETIMNGLWINGVLHKTFPENKYICSIVLSGDDVFCVLNPSTGKDEGIIYHAGESFSIPSGFLCIGDKVLSLINGFLYVGLSSSTCEPPIVWKSGQMDTLDINGYISSISSRALDK